MFGGFDTIGPSLHILPGLHCLLSTMLSTLQIFTLSGTVVAEAELYIRYLMVMSLPFDQVLSALTISDLLI